MILFLFNEITSPMRYLFVFFWLFSSCIALQCKLGLMIKMISSTRGHEQDLNHVAAASVMNNCCKKDRAIPPRPSHFDHISWCVHLCVLAHKSWTPSSNSLRNLSWWTLVFISDSSLFPLNFKNLNLVKGDSNQQPPAPQSTFCHWAICLDGVGQYDEGRCKSCCFTRCGWIQLQLLY